MHSHVEEQLAHQYRETRSSMAITGQTFWGKGLVIVVYRSPEDKWTLAITRPDGCTLMLMEGHSWENIERKLTKGPKL